MRLLSRVKIVLFTAVGLLLLAACAAPAAEQIEVPPAPADTSSVDTAVEDAPIVEDAGEDKPAAVAAKPQLVEFYADW